MSSSASTTSSLLRFGPSSRLQDAPLPPPAPLVNTSISAASDGGSSTGKHRPRRARCCCCCCSYSSQGDADLQPSSSVVMTRPGCADLDVHGARYCLPQRHHATANCTFSIQRSDHWTLLTYLLEVVLWCPALSSSAASVIALR